MPGAGLVLRSQILAQRFGDRWRIKEQLGRGGQGDVFRVEDELGEHADDCALKRIRNPKGMLGLRLRSKPSAGCATQTSSSF